MIDFICKELTTYGFVNPTEQQNQTIPAKNQVLHLRNLPSSNYVKLLKMRARHVKYRHARKGL